MAEGNYPFPSTYITFSVSTGAATDPDPEPKLQPKPNPHQVTTGAATPLPAWPMRVACAQGLNEDLGIRLSGAVEDVRCNLSLGDSP